MNGTSTLSTKALEINIAIKTSTWYGVKKIRAGCRLLKNNDYDVRIEHSRTVIGGRPKEITVKETC
jgi:hypothetical protein